MNNAKLQLMLCANAHNKDSCEHELEEENTRYLRHCFPQGLVDKMASPSPLPPDESQVYLERGYPRRGSDSPQCSRRKTSCASNDGSANVKHSSKPSKKLGLPPKHGKKGYKISSKHGSDYKHATMSGGDVTTLDTNEMHRHSSNKTFSEIKIDHRGNQYNKLGEKIVKEKYKKISELDDITNNMSSADQKKLSEAQHMLGLVDTDDTSHENRKTRQKHHSKGHASHVLDRQISSNTHWNFQPTCTVPVLQTKQSTPDSTATSKQQTTNRGTLKLDLFPQPLPSNQMASPSNQTVLPSNQSVSPSNQSLFPSNHSVPSNKFRLSVPSSSGNDMTSVSVLSYSAPCTPLSASSPLFPPLAVDVNTGGHRTSLSLEPLPHYGLSDDPARPQTKVTLSLRPPSSPPSSGPGVTYTTYSLKDGVQAQLHISIGANLSQSPEPQTVIDNSETISAATKNILTAQIERKAKLENALKCEKERLSAIKRDIMCIDQKIKQHFSLELSSSDEDFYEHIYTGQKIAPLSFSRKSSQAGTESPGWICYMCTFLNHPMLPKCEQCDMLRVNLDTKPPPASLSLLKLKDIYHDKFSIVWTNHRIQMSTIIEICILKSLMIHILLEILFTAGLCDVRS
ncbi:hypothetical protein M8J75_010346 [Diaphorina citri]|nr:hypothetical protein M8J75_010346 [Diaphorina citri]